MLGKVTKKYDVPSGTILLLLRLIQHTHLYTLSPDCKACDLSLAMRLLPTILLLAIANCSNVVNAGGAANAAANALRSVDYRYFVAGGVCAATSHGITTPIDVVKTRMQAQPEVRLIKIFRITSDLQYLKMIKIRNLYY